MAERAFFGPAQNDQENVSTQKELKLYFTTHDQLQQHASFPALQTPSSSSHVYPSPSSTAHAHPLSHDACPCRSAFYGPAYHRHYQHPYDDHHHHRHADAPHHDKPYLLDELRTCAKLKAEIVAHPLFDSLLQAHVECLSVGISTHHIQAMDAQLANKHNVMLKYLMLSKNMDVEHASARVDVASSRKEIDAFMENYLKLLLSWKKQLEVFVRPPTIKALSSFSEIKQAFCELTGVSLDEIPSGMKVDQEWEDMCLDLELDDSDYGTESQSDIDRSLFEHIRTELKDKLKENYRENIQAMREEIIRKRQAGKLPGDVTSLKKWWNTHSKWPYPTEEEKRKLAQETGLEMRQINNWFINHRKRNWVNRHSAPPPASNAASAGSSSLQQG